MSANQQALFTATGASAPGLALTNLGAESGTTITTIVSVPAGCLIVVGYANSTATPTDSSGNTYRLAQTVLSPIGKRLSLYYCANCLALPSGSSITTSGASQGTAAFTGGILTTSPLDQAVAASGTGTNISVTSGVPAESGELWIGIMVLDTTATLTNPSGYLPPLNSPIAGVLLSGNKIA